MFESTTKISYLCSRICFKFGGTMVAICGNKIYANKYSVFGPIDSQVDYKFENGIEETYSSNIIAKMKVDEPQDMNCLQKLQSKNLFNETKETLKYIFGKRRI